MQDVSIFFYPIRIIEQLVPAPLQSPDNLFPSFLLLQRLAGATLLVFANKQDLPGALTKEAIREVK